METIYTENETSRCILECVKIEPSQSRARVASDAGAKQDGQEHHRRWAVYETPPVVWQQHPPTSTDHELLSRARDEKRWSRDAITDAPTPDATPHSELRSAYDAERDAEARLFKGVQASQNAEHLGFDDRTASMCDRMGTC